MKGHEPITKDTVVSRTKEVLASKMDGETIMMSIAGGSYYGMDNIGSRIWELIAEPIRVSDLCDRLMEEFDVEIDQCLADVIAFLNALGENKLIKT